MMSRRIRLAISWSSATDFGIAIIQFYRAEGGRFVRPATGSGGKKGKSQKSKVIWWRERASFDGRRRRLDGAEQQVHHSHVLEFVRDRSDDLADFVVRNLGGAKAFWNIELRDELGGPVGARQGRGFRIGRVERNTEPFGHRTKTVGGHFRHETHGVGQGNARGNAVRHIPARADLVA